MRNALVVFLLALAALVVALATYDATQVGPRLAEVERILAGGDPQDVHPPVQVARLVDAQLPRLRATVGSQVQAAIEPASGSRSIMRRVAWPYLLSLHLDRVRLQGLHATLAWNGRDRGLNRFALRAFGKPLDQLTPVQAATVVAYTHAPAVYARHPDWLRVRAQRLLERAGPMEDVELNTASAH